MKTYIRVISNRHIISRFSTVASALDAFMAASLAVRALVAFTLIGILTVTATVSLAVESVPASVPSDRNILSKYNHELHEAKVFGPLKIDCAHCHNFTVVSGKATANEDLKVATFRQPMRQLCHECHQGSQVEYRNAPKACYTCHTSIENMNQIKPQNHSNVDWKHAHASTARSNPESCSTCHSNSQCVKCHAQRNDVFMVNHSRNFRFFHSIEARVQPQKCDTCHTKNYCMKCHLGKGR